MVLTKNKMQLLDQKLIWCRTSSTCRRRTSTRLGGWLTWAILNMARQCSCARSTVFRYFQMAHHPGYSSHTLPRLSTNFRGRLFGHLTTASKQFLLPASCGLGYWLLVSGIYEIKSSYETFSPSPFLLYTRHRSHFLKTQAGQQQPKWEQKIRIRFPCTLLTMYQSGIWECRRTTGDLMVQLYLDYLEKSVQETYKNVDHDGSQPLHWYL